MAKTATDVLAVARRNLGITETPMGSNKTPYAAAAGHANGYPWCATFLVACFRAQKIKLGNESAYTPSLYNSMAKVARADVKPGDLMFMYFPSKGRIAHVGIVEAVFPSYVITIEGNTDEAGGRTGGKVMRKKRAYKDLSFTRPEYAPPPPPKPAPKRRPADPVLRVGNTGQKVLDIQRALNKAGHRVAMDAQFGPLTKKAVQAFQKKKGLVADGVVGPATWHALRVVVHGPDYQR